MIVDMIMSWETLATGILSIIDVFLLFWFFSSIKEAIRNKTNFGGNFIQIFFPSIGLLITFIFWYFLLHHLGII